MRVGRDMVAGGGGGVWERGVGLLAVGGVGGGGLGGRGVVGVGWFVWVIWRRGVSLVVGVFWWCPGGELSGGYLEVSCLGLPGAGDYLTLTGGYL